MTDFYILSLAGYSGEIWGILYDWAVPDYGDGFWIGGCRQQVQTGGDVLWAYNSSETGVFLKVVPSDVTVKKGVSRFWNCYNLCLLGVKPNGHASIGK